ncbi:unnamed protein product [Brassicogethes aeneus]|uniref:Uncharacterized protein n=1 Tax=Brassicogethes aeneus TaxID=1431903 RepID=A0A9P0FDK9_BRAAE|nr:unnamed protein product [Brassicogethes aeneus]
MKIFVVLLAVVLGSQAHQEYGDDHHARDGIEPVLQRHATRSLPTNLKSSPILNQARYMGYRSAPVDQKPEVVSKRSWFGNKHRPSLFHRKPHRRLFHPHHRSVLPIETRSDKKQLGDSESVKKQLRDSVEALKQAPDAEAEIVVDPHSARAFLLHRSNELPLVRSPWYARSASIEPSLPSSRHPPIQFADSADLADPIKQARDAEADIVARTFMLPRSNELPLVRSPWYARSASIEPSLPSSRHPPIQFADSADLVDPIKQARDAEVDIVARTFRSNELPLVRSPWYARSANIEHSSRHAPIQFADSADFVAPISRSQEPELPLVRSPWYARSANVQPTLPSSRHPPIQFADSVDLEPLKQARDAEANIVVEPHSARAFLLHRSHELPHVRSPWYARSAPTSSRHSPIQFADSVDLEPLKQARDGEADIVVDPHSARAFLLHRSHELPHLRSPWYARSAPTSSRHSPIQFADSVDLEPLKQSRDGEADIVVDPHSARAFLLHRSNELPHYRSPWYARSADIQPSSRHPPIQFADSVDLEPLKQARDGEADIVVDPHSARAFLLHRSHGSFQVRNPWYRRHYQSYRSEPTELRIQLRDAQPADSEDASSRLDASGFFDQPDNFAAAFIDEEGDQQFDSEPAEQHTDSGVFDFAEQRYDSETLTNRQNQPAD